LGTMLVLLVAAGGVGLAGQDCNPFQGTCECTGGTCEGTDEGEYIYGWQVGPQSANETIYGYGGDDVITGRGGSDRIDGGSGNDTIEGDSGSYPQRNDILVGGSGNDWLYGDGGNNDRCDGGVGFDRAHRSCEFMVRIEKTISY
jgi:Ca2+-binding RTX toxin-like protein